MTESEGDSGVHRDVVLSEPLGVRSISLGSDPGRRRCLQLAAKRTVEHVAQAGRAIVAVVVVAIELVLRKAIGLERLLEKQTLLRREVQLLREERPVALGIRLEHRLEIDSFHPVAGVSGEEASEKVR